MPVIIIGWTAWLALGGWPSTPHTVAVEGKQKEEPHLRLLGKTRGNRAGVMMEGELAGKLVTVEGWGEEAKQQQQQQWEEWVKKGWGSELLLQGPLGTYPTHSDIDKLSFTMFWAFSFSKIYSHNSQEFNFFSTQPTMTLFENLNFFFLF